MAPLPPFYDPEKVAHLWRVPYQERAAQAYAWARTHGLTPAAEDRFETALVLIDVQNTFCLPDFELYVGGRSGTGAIADNRRLCEFIYRNLGRITRIIPTLDTHTALQIFHPAFLVNAAGEHPAPLTMVSTADIRTRRWGFDTALAEGLGVTPDYGQRQLEYYVDTLEKQGKYTLTIWPYHAMLGGLGHALVSAVEEAVFFHSIARGSHTQFHFKGQNPFTEHYSALKPEVGHDVEGRLLGRPSPALLDLLHSHDAIWIAGQAKSHCVAWTVADLLDQIRATDPALARKVYLLEDCTSPVVVPGVADFTGLADEAFAGFARAGVNVVRSTTPLEEMFALENQGALV